MKSGLSSTNSDKSIHSFLQSLPKTEIHLHLEGCLTVERLQQLIQKNSIQISEQELLEKFQFQGLNGFIDFIFFLQSLVHKPEDLTFFLDGLEEYLLANTILYAEVYFATSFLLKQGLPYKELLEVVVQRLKQIQQRHNIEVKLLLNIPRTFGPEKALEVLQEILKVSSPLVVAVDLAGKEQYGPARDFAQVFQLAKKSGLHVIAHAGEDGGPLSIWEALNLLGAERIGHATSAFQDPELMRHMKNNRIPLDIAISSSIRTQRFVSTIEDHPVKIYYKEGLLLSINSDDPAIFETSLTEEYYKLYKYLGFSLDEIIGLIHQGVLCSFHPEKEALWQRMKQKIDVVRQEYGL